MRTVVLGSAFFIVGFIISIVMSKTIFAPPLPLRFDIDNDRELSFAEFRAARSAIFDLADFNGDGRLTRAEIALLTKESKGGLPASIASTIRYKRFDSNKDGVVTFNEVRNLKKVKQLFDEYDQNSNGNIDADEIGKSGLGVLLIKR